MVYYATIDTNIIVSSFIKSDSNPRKIIDLILDGTIIPLINDEIIMEYYDVLSRNNFSFDMDNVFSLLSDIEEKGIKLGRTKTEEQFIDRDDIVFYEITLTGRSTGDAYLVTGNKKHFPKKYFVVSPKEMLEIIKRG